MQAGVVGVVDGTFSVVDSGTDTVVDGDRELRRSLEIDRVFSLPSGEMAFAGRAAAERLRETETHEIDDGEIRVRERPQIETRYTEFVGVPGEFVVVDSSDGAFAFELIGTDTNTTIERATIDLDAFYADHEAARPWKAGFFGTDDDAPTGVFHGSDLRSNHDLTAVLDSSSLNQLGVTYSDDGTRIKLTATRSGYVELYRPSDLDAADYLTYLDDELLPYVDGYEPTVAVAQ